MNDVVKAWMNPALLDEMDEGVLNAPQDILGMHFYENVQIFVVRRPGARRVWVFDPEGTRDLELELLDVGLGIFGADIKNKKKQFKDYRVRIEYSPGDVVETADPYSFETTFTEFDRYIFGEGRHFKVFDKLGAHPGEVNGVKGTHFAVWAPDARSVSVVGNFNMWDGRLHTMRLLGESGIFDLFIPDVGEGAVYKYQITSRSGELLYKTDPYGNYAELRPGNASVVTSLEGYEWNDEDYMKAHAKKKREQRDRGPMNIYEVHLGSWKKRVEDDDNGFFSYRELAAMLGDYVVEMGYTHIELMGISEYPFDGSWGYQVGCYYAPTSRYGNPKDFMYFVDEMHRRGIEVILDWVPAHFPKDAHCLGNFDGQALYEHPDRRRGEHPDWGTYIFDYGRKGVQNFLIANALFWIEKFHIDGLRVDAVASMLYLDYGKQDGDWLPNEDGGNEHYEAVDFLQNLNTAVAKYHPDAYIIAEESTAWPGVTEPVENGGLGFSMKWNMGWMNDFLEYMKLDPYFKQFHHDQLCFSLSYHLSERYILVLSHDEVVHGKCSLLNKMPGLKGDKFAALKAAYGFMYGHPGKKLLFMGQEFAQEREWSEMRSLDWFLLDEEPHKGIQRFVKDFNKLYKDYSALWYNDNDMMGFEWMDVASAESSTVAFVRRGKTKRRQLLFMVNFTPVGHEKYQTKVPCGGTFREIMNSDKSIYGGQDRLNSEPIRAKKNKGETSKAGDGEYYIECNLPPLSVVVMEYDYKD
ncbi:1,4-alpha-glucan branching protein GlgB [Eubacterium xylanophilum]|uniref:1,4-alpha-glucan branching protein GlgB n=1 Tax=Eubacterium xylanophilum TaxID=39497 RepID=UPI0004AF1292|nr:1,4-alpha-glucan branching protein GlgB [Eubacterium xylanophilum]